MAHTSSAPTRSRTLPRRDPRIHGNKRHSKQSDLFDPDELRRRLEAHLVEQKLQAERQRAKEVGQKNGAYHHIPKVAALDFARTATPEILGQGERHVHKLGEIALKRHADRANIEPHLPATNPFDLKCIQAADQARMQREIESNRNQFQRTKELKDAAEYDRERNLNKVPQRTFGLDLRASHKDMRSRPLSTNDIPWEGEIETQTPIFHTRTKPKFFPTYTTNDRQDWAQRDEAGVDPHLSVKKRASLLLKRSESKLMLKSIREQNHPDPVDESVHDITGADVKSVHTTNGSQDGTQQEEAGVGARRPARHRSSLFLRRPDSVFMLKTRREQSHADPLDDDPTGADVKPVYATDCRDGAEQGEAGVGANQSVRQRASLFLRRSESILILKSRKERNHPDPVDDDITVADVKSIFTTNSQDGAQQAEAGIGAHRSVRQRASLFLRRPESILMSKTRKEQIRPVPVDESDYDITGAEVKPIHTLNRLQDGAQRNEDEIDAHRKQRESIFLRRSEPTLMLKSRREQNHPVPMDEMDHDTIGVGVKHKRGNLCCCFMR